MKNIILALLLTVWIVHHYTPKPGRGVSFGWEETIYKTDKNPIIRKGGYAYTWPPFYRVELSDRVLYLPFNSTWIEEIKE